MHLPRHNGNTNALNIVLPDRSSISSSPRTPRTPSASSYTLFTNTANRYSTDSWNSSNAADELVFDWKPDQIRLLTRTLDALPPQVLTPFNGPIPPSNLLDKIARGVSEAKGPLEWPHSLRATRVKLIELSRARAKEEKPERTGGYSDVDMDDNGESRFPDGLGKTHRPRRPLYRQSSMDFMNAADLRDGDNIELVSDRLKQHERLISKSNFHPYAHSVVRGRLASPACSANFSLIGASSPSSSTLNTLSSFGSANRLMRRTSSNISSTSASSVSMNGSVPCADPRLERVRISGSYYPPPPPPKDTRLAPSQKENLDSSPLTGVKRTSSYGALAQEAKRDALIVKADNNKDNSAYASSDEEEKIRTKGAKKMRVKDMSELSPAAHIDPSTPPTPSTPASPRKSRTKVPVTAPPYLSCKSLAAPKSPTPKPKKRITPDSPASPAGPSATEGRKRPTPMNLQRNPSMFGAELPQPSPALASEPLVRPRQHYASSPAPIGRLAASPELLRAPTSDASSQKSKTLRRVHRLTLGRRISFNSLAVPGEDADVEGDGEELGSRRRSLRKLPRDVGQLGSAFQPH
ncbi:hypothetical protein H0H92_015092 [Tricholoma furcatifolium]|nr:hypothetical protein H0H92_015092 [Tricholoma furcatifolium]